MPVTTFPFPEKYRYQSGFANHHETSAVADALPTGASNPQRAPHGLYNEKLSGTAFTAPRADNYQTWLYRILPASAHAPFEPTTRGAFDSSSPHDTADWQHVPNQLRWDPFDLDPTADWIAGLRLLAGAGSPTTKTGLGVYVYAAGASMPLTHAFYSADGDLLIVPQQGALDIQTELGCLLVRPHEICVIPRGVRYRVALPDGPARGFALELYQGHFALPELGPLGSSGLANARDFLAPVAHFDDDDDTAPCEYTVFAKFAGRLFAAQQAHTPFDVVAWHGNYYPYKYDLGRFNTMGSVSYDHPDPSIYTVLTAPSDRPGTAVADFVIFPPRWLVAEDTFRPPWFHRNTMSEFMGLVAGAYDAKEGGGFQPAGASLHNVMCAHGPDMATFEKARAAELRPAKVGEGSLAFMFESSLMLGVTDWALRRCGKVQDDYNATSWEPLRRRFTLADVPGGQRSNLI